MQEGRQSLHARYQPGFMIRFYEAAGIQDDSGVIAFHIFVAIAKGGRRMFVVKEPETFHTGQEIEVWMAVQKIPEGPQVRVVPHIVFFNATVFHEQGGLGPDDQSGVAVDGRFAQADELLQLGSEGVGNYFFVGIDIRLDDDDIVAGGLCLVIGSCYPG